MPALPGRWLIDVFPLGLLPTLQFKDLSRMPRNQTELWLPVVQLRRDTLEMFRSIFTAIIHRNLFDHELTDILSQPLQQHSFRWRSRFAESLGRFEDVGRRRVHIEIVTLVS
jgi:DICT domain-containing protein